ncbi:glycosyl hydrolase, partial [Streptomyces niveus]
MPRKHLSRLAIAALSLGLVATLAPSAGADPAPQGDKHGSHQSHGSYKQVGYFAQWGVYGRNYQVKDMDTSGAAARLTHINYAFGNVS